MIRCCRHIMPDGARCQSPALAGQPFCYQHDRLHHVVSKPKSDSTNRITLRPLEDRRSVLMALSDVICGLAGGKIDPKTAARLIYGLQVASQVAANHPLLVSGKPVESVDFTKTGDEMAPALLICTDDDYCESCPRAAGCQLKKAVQYRADHGIAAANSQEDESEDEDEDEQDDNEEDDEEDEDNEDEEDDPAQESAA
jgi:hypothetical protein